MINLSNNDIAGINLDLGVLHMLSSLFNCAILPCPLSYLGVPLGGNRSSLSFGEIVVEYVTKRLARWRGSFFSHGGCIT